MATVPESHAVGARHRTTAFSQSRTESPSAQQLDFYKAMKDFKQMFPTMDDEIIEAVLRANNGAVDATIDQLLTMNLDIDDTDDSTLHSSGFTPEMLDSSTSSEDEDAPPPYPVEVASSGPPPPSYADFTSQQASKGAISKKPAPQTTSVNPSAKPKITLNDDLIHLGESQEEPDEVDFDPFSSSASALPPPSVSDLDLVTPKQPIVAQTPSSPVVHPPVETNTPIATPSQQLPAKTLYSPSKWNPPMLGALPKDFLRIDMSRSPCRSPRSGRTLSPSPGPVSHAKSPDPSEQSRRSRNSSGEHRQSRQQNNAHTHTISSHTINQRIAENERQRYHAEGAHDVEKIQMLEDERLALLLQNEEFLTELRQDNDFMRHLERDRMNATAFERPQDVGPEMDPNRPKPDQLEGYGDDHIETLGAYPHDKDVAFPMDENAELRRQLKHMGGSSKKKFTALARKFFSKRKKKSSKILKDPTGASTMNLLEEEEVNGGDSLNGTNQSDYRELKDPEVLAGVPSYKTWRQPDYYPEGVETLHTDTTTNTADGIC